MDIIEIFRFIIKIIFVFILTGFVLSFFLKINMNKDEIFDKFYNQKQKTEGVSNDVSNPFYIDEEFQKQLSLSNDFFEKINKNNNRLEELENKFEIFKAEQKIKERELTLTSDNNDKGLESKNKTEEVNNE